MQWSNHVGRNRREDLSLVRLNYPRRFPNSTASESARSRWNDDDITEFPLRCLERLFGTFVARGKPNRYGEHVMSTISATAVSARKPLYQSLFVQVLAALLLGIALGMAV